MKQQWVVRGLLALHLETARTKEEFLAFVQEELPGAEVVVEFDGGHRDALVEIDGETIEVEVVKNAA